MNSMYKIQNIEFISSCHERVECARVFRSEFDWCYDPMDFPTDKIQMFRELSIELKTVQKEINVL